MCHAVGFSSLGTFSRTFSELMGESPTPYRAARADGGQAIPGCFAMAWGRPRTATSDKPSGAPQP